MKLMRLFVGVASASLVAWLAGCAAPSSGPSSPPPAPSLSSASPADAQVMLTWGASSGATSYDVYYTQGTTVTTATGTKVSGVSSPYTVSGLIDGVEYAFLVTAVDSAGQSPASGTMATPVGAAPRISQTLYTSSTAIIGNWIGGGSVLSYNLYWAAGSTVSTATGTKVTGVTPGQVVNALSSGTQYAFIITPVYTGGEGPASSVVTVTPSSNPQIGIQGGQTSAMAVLGTPAPATVNSGIIVENVGGGTLSGMSANVTYLTGGTGWADVTTGSTLGSQNLTNTQTYTIPVTLTTSGLSSSTPNTATITVSGSGVASLTYTVTFTVSSASTTVGSFSVSPPVSAGTYDFGGVTAATTVGFVLFAMTNNSGGTLSTGAPLASTPSLPFSLFPGLTADSTSIGNGSAANFGIILTPSVFGQVSPQTETITWSGGTGSPYAFSIQGTGQ